MNPSGQVVYRSLENPAGEPRDFVLAGRPLTETHRLRADPAALLAFYPALQGKLLTDPWGKEVPYLPLAADPASVRVECQSEPYQPDSALRTLHGAVRAVVGQSTTCMQHVCSWEADKICLAPADYADIAATNLLADLKLPDMGEGLWHEPQSTLREWDAARSDHPGELPAVERSGFVNPIGVAGMVFTADGWLALAHRSRSVSTYADRLGPAASGYVDWADVQSCQGGCLDDLLQVALRREITEELHLLADEIHGMTPLGFFRELYRAGLCQGFYAFHTRLSSDELFERAVTARDRGEFAGMVFIPAAGKPVGNLLKRRIIGIPPVGLEAQGLLSAFLRKGLPKEARNIFTLRNHAHKPN